MRIYDENAVLVYPYYLIAYCIYNLLFLAIRGAHNVVFVSVLLELLLGIIENGIDEDR